MPVVRIVLDELGSTRRCGGKRGERTGVVFEGALGALAASFSLFSLVFSFAFSLVFTPYRIEMHCRREVAIQGSYLRIARGDGR